MTINVSEASAHGAAVLAGFGTGIYQSVQEGCDKTIKVTNSIKPVKKEVEIYKGYYGIFK